MVFKKAIVLCLVFVSAFAASNAEQCSDFIFSQLEYDGNWDPYPSAFDQIYLYLINTTSLRIQQKRRVIRVEDDILFLSPFLLMTGSGAYPEFSDDNIKRLRRYLEAGGILFIDSGEQPGFNNSVARTLSRVFPGNPPVKIPAEDAIFKAYYLVNYVSGLHIRYPYLEAVRINNRIAVIISHNDLLGVWPRDRSGLWKNTLIPDKYEQRKEALKLTLNIILYSVCGSYKSDPVHQDSIRRKLGR